MAKFSLKTLFRSIADKIFETGQPNSRPVSGNEPEEFKSCDDLINDMDIALATEDLNGAGKALVSLARDYAQDGYARDTMFDGIDECVAIFGPTPDLVAITRAMAQTAGTEKLATSLLLIAADIERDLATPAHQKTVLRPFSFRRPK